jgi:non-ribosomal peptide synthetase component F
MTLSLLFKCLLYRYTGQKDIVVGSPIANRHYKETEDLIGFFVNTLALRTTFEGKGLFIDVLKRVKEQLLKLINTKMFPLNS